MYTSTCVYIYIYIHTHVCKKNEAGGRVELLVWVALFAVFVVVVPPSCLCLSFSRVVCVVPYALILA